MKNKFSNEVGGHNFIMSYLPRIIIETYFCRVQHYLITIFVAVLVAMLGITVISYVMTVGHSFNTPEYNWLAMTAYFVMNITGIVVLSKFIMTRLSPLFDK